MACFAVVISVLGACKTGKDSAPSTEYGHYLVGIWDADETSFVSAAVEGKLDDVWEGFHEEYPDESRDSVRRQLVERELAVGYRYSIRFGEDGEMVMEARVGPRQVRYQGTWTELSRDEQSVTVHLASTDGRGHSAPDAGVNRLVFVDYDTILWNLALGDDVLLRRRIQLELID